MSQSELETDLKALVDGGSEDTDEALENLAQVFADNAPHMFEHPVGAAVLTVNGDPNSTYGYGTWADRGVVVGSLHAWERTA
jgi:hypothetical protein